MVKQNVLSKTNLILYLLRNFVKSMCVLYVEEILVIYCNTYYHLEMCVLSEIVHIQCIYVHADVRSSPTGTKPDTL